MRRRALAAAALACVAAGGAAEAGPPYATDDPEPTQLGHWEIYAFSAASGAGRDWDADAGLDLNYGAFEDVQLTATLPVSFSHEGAAHRTRSGAGDAELGVKYRFLNQARSGVDAAIFPRVILPTGGRRFGTGRASLLLPLWLQRDFGPWSVFGGGGYAINLGAGNRDFWQGGVALTRSVSKRLSLGGEATLEGADAAGARRTAALDIGGIYKLAGPFSLLVSGGPTWENRGASGWRGYAALGISF